MIKEIKVLHLISSSGFFGAERVVIELAEASQQQGIKSFIGVFRNIRNIHIEVAEEAWDKGLQTIIFNCRERLDLRVIKALRGFVRFNKIHIIHSHGYKANIYAFFAALFLHVKRVTTCHNWISSNPKMYLYEILDKLFLKTFDRVVVVSEAIKSEVLHCGISENKIAVITNGINLDRFGNKNRIRETRKNFGITEDEKIIGLVSRLTAEKGHVYLLKAAKDIVSEFPRVRFLIIGDGPLRRELEDMVSALQLRNKVIFAGLQKDIPDILAAVDIFVLPSLTEGLPMAMLEAMAAGRPLIASRVGAIPKIIENGVNGLLVEPGNSDDLRKAIIELLRDPKRADMFSKAGLELIANKFSSKRMAEDYKQVYRQVINQ